MDTPILLPHERLDEVNHGICLIQNTQGLTFGTDALLLAAFLPRTPVEKATELGGGTGIISLLALKTKRISHIDCIEVQAPFAELIARNAALNGLDDRLISHAADLRDYTAVGERCGKMDVVFANPPYMVSSGKENRAPEKQAARHEVFGGIADFVTAAARLLRYGGRFYCVYRPDRLVGLLSAMRNHRLEPKILQTVCANTESAPSMVLVMAQKGGNEGLITPPTLFLNRDGSTELTERAAKIYDTLSFE
jgi:tRNA1(Val) A37 N6-methylase TrmN6